MLGQQNNKKSTTGLQYCRLRFHYVQPLCMVYISQSIVLPFQVTLLVGLHRQISSLLLHSQGRFITFYTCNYYAEAGLLVQRSMLPATTTSWRTTDDCRHTSYFHATLKHLQSHPAKGGTALPGSIFSIRIKQLSILLVYGESMAFNEQILEGFRPNVFELLAQEAMGQALRPALDYFIKVRDPRELAKT